jgi:hypothetical protein
MAAPPELDEDHYRLRLDDFHLLGCWLQQERIQISPEAVALAIRTIPTARAATKEHGDLVDLRAYLEQIERLTDLVSRAIGWAWRSFAGRLIPYWRLTDSEMIVAVRNHRHTRAWGVHHVHMHHRQLALHVLHRGLLLFVGDNTIRPLNVST